MMAFFDMMAIPDHVMVQGDFGWARMENGNDGHWQWKGLDVITV